MMPTNIGDACAGCGARKREAAFGGGHNGFPHLPGCRWIHKRLKPGRKPGGQAVRL